MQKRQQKSHLVQAQINSLHVSRLQKLYGSRQALCDITMSIHVGRVMGLVGSNGAGKTTTMRCVAGHIAPSAGAIQQFDGTAVTRQQLAEQVILIPETPVIYDDITVWDHFEFVALARRLGTDWRTQATSLMDRFDLTPYSKYLGRQLSKGNRQKTLIVCAVLSNVRFLFFDEPLVGLDPAGQDELFRTLCLLRDGGHAVVLSTHLIEFASRICDEIVIIEQGVSRAVEATGDATDRLTSVLTNLGLRGLTLGP